MHGQSTRDTIVAAALQGILSAKLNDHTISRCLSEAELICIRRDVAEVATAVMHHIGDLHERDLREQYAGQIMASLLSYEGYENSPPSTVASVAVTAADALIAELRKAR